MHIGNSEQILALLLMGDLVKAVFVRRSNVASEAFGPFSHLALASVRGSLR